MFSHVMIGSNNIEKSEAFYDAVLNVLQIDGAYKHINETGQTRVFYFHEGSVFCITEPINGKRATVANGSTIGFRCYLPEQVEDFHDVAIAHGAISIEDPPGWRKTNMGSMYLGYFLDPDGHKICGVYQPEHE